MTLPPALTWAHLLPARAAYAYASGNGDANRAAAAAPDWLRAGLAARDAALGAGRDESCRVTVAWQELPAGWDRGQGLVAVNCRGLSAETLHEAGFAYARQFAVLPSLAAARWFVPLDAPALSAAALSLYTPTRVSARLKRWAARAAMYLRAPFWHRDRVWIAARQTPPLERAMRGLFPETDVRLALSAGAPEPARNRKASVAVLAPDGKLLAFGKAAGSGLARHIASHEADALRALADLPGTQGAVPRLLFAGDVDGVFVTAQTPLAGRPTGPRLTPAIRRFLESLHTGVIMPASKTGLICGLPKRFAALGPGGARLADALDGLMPLLDETTVPVTVIHGDFAPWNLREHRGAVAAFDWEYAELQGIPLFDETHFRLQVGSHLHAWSAEQAHEELRRWAIERPLGLRPDQVAALQGVYLIDNLARLLGEGYEKTDEMVAWYLRLLAMTAGQPKAVAA